MYQTSFYQNSCDTSCTPTSTSYNGMSTTVTCTSPINQQCLVGYGSSSNSGNLTTCPLGYNFCKVSLYYSGPDLIYTF